MSWLFQIVFGCQPKSEFLHKTRAGKSQLVCADFDLLKGSRYRLTFSAQYLTSTSLEMGTVSTLINSLKVCLVLLQPLCVSFFVFFPHLKIITVLQCLVNYRGCCQYALGTAFLHSPMREMHWSWKHTRRKVLHNKNSPLLRCYQYKQFSDFQWRWCAYHVSLSCFLTCLTKMASPPGQTGLQHGLCLFCRYCRAG